MYQGEGVSITAGGFGISSELGDPSGRADRAIEPIEAQRIFGLSSRY
jgi:hypothetical protein